MSAVQTSDRYEVLGPPAFDALPHAYVLARGLTFVDVFRTCSAAEYAARMLNDGLATVNPHAVVGCRVEVQR